MSEILGEQPITTENHLHAVVLGEKVTEFPKDLYIPPEALRVFLEAFEGPLDLLLYLIKKQNIDILDIPIAAITRQYMQYIEIMHDMQLELAAEYLVMAAMLAEIKSRLLLPRPIEENEDGDDDPRAELIRRLQEYERFKQAAEDLEKLKRLERDIFVAKVEPPEIEFEAPQPEVKLSQVIAAFRDVMMHAKLYADHQVMREQLSIRERMSFILSTVKSNEFTEFTKLFKPEEGRMGVVVTLIAILELIRQSVLELVQAKMFAPIYVKAKE